jgi:hypothetical protein
MDSTAAPATGYQIRFEPLRAAAQPLVFHCEAHGRVELDALGGRARVDYLYARALVGRDFAQPAIVRRALHRVQGARTLQGMG